MRTLIATLIVPLVVVCGFLSPAVFDQKMPFEDVASAVFMVGFQYVFFLAFTAAIVLFLRFFWRRWDFMRGWVAALIGAGLGGAAMVAFVAACTRVPVFASQPIPLFGYARGIATLSITGAAAGLLFWTIAKAEMRPNTSLERTREG